MSLGRMATALRLRCVPTEKKREDTMARQLLDTARMTKKLVLKKEAVRVLSAKELDAVQGGGAVLDWIGEKVGGAVFGFKSVAISA